MAAGDAPVTFAVKVAIAIITVPITAGFEGDYGNAEIAIIAGLDVDPVLPECRLDVAAGYPASTVDERHITPRRIGQAAVYRQWCADGDHDNSRIGCAGTGAHIHIRGGETPRRSFGKGRRGEHGHQRNCAIQFFLHFFLLKQRPALPLSASILFDGRACVPHTATIGKYAFFHERSMKQMRDRISSPAAMSAR